MQIRKLFIGLFTCILSISILVGCIIKNRVERQQQAEPIELTMWIQELFSTPGQLTLNRIKEFNEAYNGKIYVNLIGIPRPAYESQVDAAANAGQLPDIIAVDGPYVAKYAESGAIIPMDDYADEDFLSDFLPIIIDQGTYKDKLYQLAPKDTSVAIYYNTQMLRKAGISVPTNIEEAWTWDELLQNAKKLTKPTVYGFDMYTNYRDTEWFPYAFLPFIWSNGGEIVAPDGVTVEGYLNGPKTVEAFEFIGRMFKEGVVDTSLVDSAFQNERVAMTFNGTWLAEDLKEKYPNLQWGIMPYPVSPNTKIQFTLHGSYGYTITSNSKHPKEAFEVIKWLTNPKSVMKEYEATSDIPGRKSVLKEIPKYQVLPEKIMTDQLLTTSHSRPQTPIYPIISKNFAEAFKAVALGEDAQKALDDAVKNINSER